MSMQANVNFRESATRLDISGKVFALAFFLVLFVLAGIAVFYVLTPSKNQENMQRTFLPPVFNEQILKSASFTSLTQMGNRPVSSSQPFAF